MKAAIFEKPGLENLEIKQDIEEPKITDHDVLVRVRMCGVNPIDHMVTSGAVPIRPLPHIPDCEISGTIEGIGKHVKDDLHEGDRIIIHSRVFDGTCDMCLSGLDMLCRNGGIVSAITNGGFAEYIAVPEKNVLKVPLDIDWDIAASLPVTTLTAFHALKEASLQFNEYLLVFGASGNTGMMATQFAKRMGAVVIAVSKNEWVKDFGADNIVNEYDKIVEKVKDITNGRMADVVMNSVGIGAWESSFESVGINGRLVTFGGLTGADVKLNVQSLYTRQVKLIGSSRGTRAELRELINISKELNKSVETIQTR
jgi:NADPH:quinone reductase-like Zn-dependent oxidoreductase